jgi:hypothetical protein
MGSGIALGHRRKRTEVRRARIVPAGARADLRASIAELPAAGWAAAGERGNNTRPVGLVPQQFMAERVLESNGKPVQSEHVLD